MCSYWQTEQAEVKYLLCHLLNVDFIASTVAFANVADLAKTQELNFVDFLKQLHRNRN